MFFNVNLMLHLMLRTNVKLPNIFYVLFKKYPALFSQNKSEK